MWINPEKPSLFQRYAKKKIFQAYQNNEGHFITAHTFWLFQKFSAVRRHLPPGRPTPQTPSCPRRHLSGQCTSRSSWLAPASHQRCRWGGFSWRRSLRQSLGSLTWTKTANLEHHLAGVDIFLCRAVQQNQWNVNTIVELSTKLMNQTWNGSKPPQKNLSLQLIFTDMIT